MSLDVFEKVELPDEFVTQPCGILARRGAGKTYTALKMFEELVAAGQPVVLLDPLGVGWGLRSAADGKKPGLAVKILGGEHGDVPLEPTGGRVVAQFVVDHPGAYVIDLSSFESNAQHDRFAEDFATGLYRAKNRDRSPLHLIVDEADSFAPQKPFPDQKRMLGAFEAIVRRGRSRGLGVTLISQRPAVLNKNVLSQIEVLVALQITAPQDRAALKDWASGFSTPEELAAFLAGLATLKIGEAWVWSPQWLGVFERTRIKPRWTFDSSSTPKAGEQRVEPRVLADVDLDVLKAEMADTIEKANREDPKLLHERIRAAEAEVTQLRRELDGRPAETVEVDVERIVERDVPVLDEETVDKIEDIGRMLAEVASQLETNGGLLSDAQYALAQIQRTAEEMTLYARPVIDVARAGMRTAAEQIAAFAVPPAAAAAARRPRRGRSGASDGGVAEGDRLLDERSDLAHRTTPPVDDEYRPRAGARRMLDALVPYPAGLSTAQVATLAKVKKTGGTFGTYAAELIRAGLVVLVEGSIKNGKLRATEAGVAAAGGSSLPSDPAELRAEWRERLKARGAKVMFDYLIDNYPVVVSPAELADAAELTEDGGTFGTYLSRLRVNGLSLEYREGKTLTGVQAHPGLFLGAS